VLTKTTGFGSATPEAVQNSYDEARGAYDREPTGRINLEKAVGRVLGG
jgi:hypothetical protein